MKFLQCVVQGYWSDDEDYFQNIPHFTSDISDRLADMGIVRLSQLVPHVDKLTHLMNEQLKLRMSKDRLKDMYRALSKVPEM